MTRTSVGYSIKRSSADAGREAASSALAGLAGQPVRGVLVFANPGYNQPALLESIRSVFGTDAVLTGCSSEGTIFAGGCSQQACAVSVMAFGSETMELHAFNVPGLAKDPAAVGNEIGRRIGELGPQRARAALVFPDGVTGNITAMLGGIDAALPFQIPITGGAAGDLMKMDNRKYVTHQYLGGEVISDSVSVLVIGGSIAVDITVSHGCTPVGLPRTVTSREGGWVHTIDGRPAWDVMKEYLGGEATSLTSDDIVHLCVGEPFDPALRNAVGAGFGSEYLIRTPLAQSADGKSLFFPGGFQLGDRVQFLRRDPALVARTAHQSALALAERRHGRAPVAVLQFDCAGRGRTLFGDQTADVLVRPLQEVFTGTPWVGFFTFGEVAQIGTQTCYHNYTVALCALYDA